MSVIPYSEFGTGNKYQIDPLLCFHMKNDQTDFQIFNEKTSCDIYLYIIYVCLMIYVLYVTVIFTPQIIF